MTKLMTILKSWRLWVVVFTALTTLFTALDNGDAITWMSVYEAVRNAAIGAGAIRTVDRFGEKAGGK